MLYQYKKAKYKILIHKSVNYLLLIRFTNFNINTDQKYFKYILTPPFLWMLTNEIYFQ